MQCSSGGDTEPGDISGIGRDLRLQQSDAQAVGGENERGRVYFTTRSPK